jgi:hypothetical protein
MGNIHDILALVSVAEAMEKEDRCGALSRYELADRLLQMHILPFELTIDDLDNGNGSEVAGVYRPLFQRIRDGYMRLGAAGGDFTSRPLPR